MHEVHQLFDAVGEKSATITWNDLQQHMKDKRVYHFFKALDLEVSEAEGLFKLMDLDGNGVVDVEEFVAGCMRLRGGAKRLDLVSLLFESKRLADRMARGMGHLEQRLDGLYQISGRMSE